MDKVRVFAIASAIVLAMAGARANGPRRPSTTTFALTHVRVIDGNGTPAKTDVLPPMVRYSDGHDNRFLQGTGRDSARAAGEIPTDAGDAPGSRGIRRGPRADVAQAGTVVAPSGRMARVARLGEGYQGAEGAPRRTPP